MGVLSTMMPFIVLLLVYSTGTYGSSVAAKPEGIIKLEVPATSLQNHHLILMLQKHSGKWLGLPLLWMDQAEDGGESGGQEHLASDQERDRIINVGDVYPKWVSESKGHELESKVASGEIRLNVTGVTENFEQMNSTETFKGQRSNFAESNREMAQLSERKNENRDMNDETETVTRNGSCQSNCDEDETESELLSNDTSAQMRSSDHRILHVPNPEEQLHHAIFTIPGAKICPEGMIADSLGRCRTPFTLSSNRMKLLDTSRRFVPLVEKRSEAIVISKDFPINKENPVGDENFAIVEAEKNLNHDGEKDTADEILTRAVKVQDDDIASNTNDALNIDVDSMANVTPDLHSVAHLIRNSQMDGSSERSSSNNENNQREARIASSDVVTNSNSVTSKIEEDINPRSLENIQSQSSFVKKNPTTNRGPEKLLKRSDDPLGEDESEHRVVLTGELPRDRVPPKVDSTGVHPLTHANPTPTLASKQIIIATTIGDEDSQEAQDLVNIRNFEGTVEESSLEQNATNTSGELDVQHRGSSKGIITVSDPKDDPDSQLSENKAAPSYADENTSERNEIPNTTGCAECVRRNDAANSPNHKKTKNVKRKPNRSDEYYSLLRYFSPELYPYDFDSKTETRDLSTIRSELKKQTSRSIENTEEDNIAHTPLIKQVSRESKEIVRTNLPIETSRRLFLTSLGRRNLVNSNEVSNEESDKHKGKVLRYSNLPQTLRGVRGRNQQILERIDLSTESQEIYSAPSHNLVYEQRQGVVPQRSSEESPHSAVTRLKPAIIKNFKIDNSLEDPSIVSSNFIHQNIPVPVTQIAASASTIDSYPNKNQHYDGLFSSDSFRSHQNTNSHVHSIPPISLHRDENSKERRSSEDHRSYNERRIQVEVSSRESNEQLLLRSDLNSVRHLPNTNVRNDLRGSNLQPRQQTSYPPLYYYSPRSTLQHSHLSSSRSSGPGFRSRENFFKSKNRGGIFFESKEDSSESQFGTPKPGGILSREKLPTDSEAGLFHSPDGTSINRDGKFVRTETILVSSGSREENSEEHRSIPDNSPVLKSSYSDITYFEPSARFRSSGSSFENSRRINLYNPTFVSSGPSEKPLSLHYGPPPSATVQNNNVFGSDLSSRSQEHSNIVIPNAHLRSFTNPIDFSNEISDEKKVLIDFSNQQKSRRNQKPFSPSLPIDRESVEIPKTRFDSSRERFLGSGYYNSGRGNPIFAHEAADSREKIRNVDHSGEKYQRNSFRTGSRFIPSRRLNDDSGENFLGNVHNLGGDRSESMFQIDESDENLLGTSYTTSSKFTPSRRLNDDSGEKHVQNLYNPGGVRSSSAFLEIDDSDERNLGGSFRTSSRFTPSRRLNDDSGEKHVQNLYNPGVVRSSSAFLKIDDSDEKNLGGSFRTSSRFTPSRHRNNDSGEKHLQNLYHAGRARSPLGFLKIDDSGENNSGGSFSTGRFTPSRRLNDDSGENNFGSLYHSGGARSHGVVQIDNSYGNAYGSSHSSGTSSYYTGYGHTPFHSPKNYGRHHLPVNTLRSSIGVGSIVQDDSGEFISGRRAHSLAQGETPNQFNIDDSGQNSAERSSLSSGDRGITISFPLSNESVEKNPPRNSYSSDNTGPIQDVSSHQIDYSRGNHVRTTFSRGRGIPLSGHQFDDSGENGEIIPHFSGRGIPFASRQHDDSGENGVRTTFSTGRGFPFSRHQPEDSVEHFSIRSSFGTSKGSNQNHYQQAFKHFPQRGFDHSVGEDSVELRPSFSRHRANEWRRAGRDSSAEHSPKIVSTSPHFFKPKSKSLSLWEWANQ